MKHRSELFFGVALALGLVAVFFIAKRQQRLNAEYTRRQERTAITSITRALKDPYFRHYLPNSLADGAMPQWPTLGWIPKVHRGYFSVTARNMKSADFLLPYSSAGITVIRLSVSKGERRHPCLVLDYDDGGKRILFSEERPSRGSVCEESPVSHQPRDKLR